MKEKINSNKEGCKIKKKERENNLLFFNENF